MVNLCWKQNHSPILKPKLLFSAKVAMVGPTIATIIPTKVTVAVNLSR
jgi:hypothetical protein